MTTVQGGHSQQVWLYAQNHGYLEVRIHPSDLADLEARNEEEVVLSFVPKIKSSLSIKTTNRSMECGMKHQFFLLQTDSM